METKVFFDALRKHYNNGNGPATDAELAARMGVTRKTILNWTRQRQITPKLLMSVHKKATRRAIEEAEAQAIKPIVEFFEIEACESRQGTKWEIFSAKPNGEAHPYLSGLREALRTSKGVFIFYDSRGRALYAGQTKGRTQNLWKEINLVYNRDRGVQKIRRTRHPDSKVEFRTSHEYKRQIRPRTVQLHELAKYVSAYEVTPSLVNLVESLLIRSFANDLLNTRMEQFGRGSTE